jgi:hypothetical protein
MVVFLDIRNDTEFVFMLIKNKTAHTVDIWMKYGNAYYIPIIGKVSFFTNKKLLSPNICSRLITMYVFKKIGNCSKHNIEKTVQTISFVKSNIIFKCVYDDD